MPQVRTVISVASNVDQVVDLSPYDRFGARGGQVVVAVTCLAANTGEATYDLLVGSDQITANNAILSEPVVGGGPNTESPTSRGFGAPADPITIRIKPGTITGTPVNMVVVANIENA